MKRPDKIVPHYSEALEDIARVRDLVTWARLEELKKRKLLAKRRK